MKMMENPVSNSNEVDLNWVAPFLWCCAKQVVWAHPEAALPRLAGIDMY